ncbi:MAG: hypothetical protein ACE5KO_00500 [Candidatus Bathyarchaeia archaeon]
MSETTISWEVEESGPLYELFVKKGSAFTELRLFYKEGGRIKTTSAMSIPNEMLKDFKEIVLKLG